MTHALTPPVKLTDLTDVLAFESEESANWLDRQTGRVVVVDNEVMSALDDYAADELSDHLEDWQREQVPAAQAIAAADPRYLALPDKFEFHEYRHMEKFIGTIPTRAAPMNSGAPSRAREPSVISRTLLPDSTCWTSDMLTSKKPKTVSCSIGPRPTR